jgi:4-hydroxybenzoate polyprenyltransferase
VHAWLGATGTVPPDMAWLYPAAVAAGAALAIANGLADFERDARSARATAIVRLGRRRAWLVNVALLTVVSAIAIALAPGGGPGSTVGTVESGPAAALRDLRAVGLVLGIVALALGAIALRGDRPGLRERGWELQAVGVVAVGVGWLAGIASAH